MHTQITELPAILEFPSIGNSTEGYISIAEVEKNIPFAVKRVYWTYFTPQNVIRGYHAHKGLFQVIVAVSGKIVFRVEDMFGKKAEYTLDQPNVGLFLPPFTWREITFSHNAVLLCLASEWYDENDYIRDYSTFKNEIGKPQVQE